MSPAQLHPRHEAQRRRMRTVWGYSLLVGTCWNLALAASFAWNIDSVRRQTDELAAMTARIHFQKDHAFRLWASQHGGVYVPVDDRTPPNPYLSIIPERDLVSPAGQQLTLMNPAYMVRQLMGEYAELYGVRGRITSLQPLNPANAPDDWERQALSRLDAGAEEIFEQVAVDGAPQLRLMRPMITRESCLKCHRQQGYRVGDVRGGVGIILPLDPFLASQQETLRSLSFTYGGIWLVGAIALGLVSWGAGRGQRRRAAAEDALAEREHMYQVVADNNYDWEFWLSPEGQFLYCSPSCRRTTGYDAAAFEADPSLLVRSLHPEDRAAFEAYCQRVRNGEAPKELELRLRRRDGEERWMAHVSQRVLDEQGAFAGLRGSNRDITERKTAEQALMQSSRLVALGQMAAGMAHELNQPLTAISVMAEGQLLRLEQGRTLSPETQRDWARDTVAQVERMADLVEHLRLFSRDRMHEPSAPVSLNDAVDGALKLTRAQLASHGIALGLELAPVLPPVQGALYRLEQVVVNLVSNARDALDERGRSEPGFGPRLTVRTRRDGDRVVLEVSDNGTGIPDAVRERLFQPFVTSKTADRGTGLGLAIVHASVREHGGDIQVETAAGQGTTFRIQLPIGAGGDADAGADVDDGAPDA